MHSESLDDFLLRVRDDTRVQTHIRDLAGRLLQDWQRGIVPSPKRLKELRFAFTSSVSCEKLEYDGACAWLRVHGPAVGLQVPPIGERALCQFEGQFAKCPGYRSLG